MPVRSRKTVFRHIWGLLCSRRLTAVLLLAIGVVLLVGLWLPQVPGELDAAGQAQWWAATRERFGDSADWMASLGLFSLFSTPLFVALLAALLLNNLACTLERLGRLWREVARRPTVRLPDAAYREVPDSGTYEQARRSLRRQGWRPAAEEGGRHYFYSRTWPLAPLGTLLTHLGLLLFVLAALLHTQLAWRERLVLDPAFGESVALQHRPACSVRSDALNASRELAALVGGRIRLQAAEDGRTVTGWATPGAPLPACGANLYYLDGYGLVLRVEAADASGIPVEVVYTDAPALRFGTEGTANRFEVPAWGWSVTVKPSAQALAGSPEGTLALQVVSGTAALSQSVRLGLGWEGPLGRLALFGGQVVELDAVYDPGVGPFLAAGAALAAGSALSLLFPLRRRWARLDADGTLWVAGEEQEAAPGGTP